MAELAEIEAFLSQPGALYDVRSPLEYSHAHIPGARSFPLFSDEERAIVGTIYKKEGKNSAVIKGLELVSCKFPSFAKEAHATTDPIKVYCFRGGMRSQAMAWLFGLVDKKPALLPGGYKAFRKFVQTQLERPWSFQVLGGLTGSGKTAQLHRFLNEGQQVLDLEKIASHRGSAFGSIGQAAQPSNEAFENQIAMELLKMDPQKPIWVEDESRMIGTCKIPDELFHLMQNAPLFYLDKPFEERVSHLVAEYGTFPIETLIGATERIARKLGGQRTNDTIQLLQHGDIEAAFKLLLEYYDSSYIYNMKKRGNSWTTFSAS
jgi:tRNA 2-selenouridine synthase